MYTAVTYAQLDSKELQFFLLSSLDGKVSPPPSGDLTGPKAREFVSGGSFFQL